MTGKLSIVATPIGNLEDITLRAIRTLREADLILCEDTRATKTLLEAHDIDTPTKSYPFDTLKSGHEQNPHPKIQEVIEELNAGKHLALVSEAGTPAVSDPGSLLVKFVREQCGDEVTIEAIPGPSALTAALSIAGVPASEFLFLGFLPHKKGRETLFAEIAGSKRTAVFYESPHRIEKTLTSLSDHLDETKQVTVCRELTKVYEEVVCGSAQEVAAYFADHPDKVRGEFVVIVSRA